MNSHYLIVSLGSEYPSSDDFSAYQWTPLISTVTGEVSAYFCDTIRSECRALFDNVLSGNTSFADNNAPVILSNIEIPAGVAIPSGAEMRAYLNASHFNRLGLLLTEDVN